MGEGGIRGRAAAVPQRVGPAVFAFTFIAVSLWSATARTGVVDAASLLGPGPVFPGASAVFPGGGTVFPGGGTVPIAAAALVLASASLLALRAVPRTPVPLFGIAFVAYLGVSLWPPVLVASYVAATTLRRPALLAAYAGAAGLVLVAPAALATLLGAGGADGGVVQGALGGVVLFVVLPTTAGLWIRARRDVEAGLRERAEFLEREQVARSERARAQERARIAREMHDVVAHRVSLMVMQAGAMQVNAADERTATDAAELRTTGREALTQLREVLGVLRSPDAGDGGDRLGPQPTLEDLDALLQRSRAAGVVVERRDEGEPGHLPLLVERTAYRVVQEALTNVHKHAGGARTSVVLRHRPEELEVAVRNAAPEEAEDPPLPGGGSGLVGLQERVALLGGALSARRAEDGGFALEARLPVAGAASLDDEGEADDPGDDRR